jgi:hypothetical protein
VALGWLNPYIAGHYRLEVTNDVFNDMEYALSYRPVTIALGLQHGVVLSSRLAL